jgi:hypothetical protein
MNEGDIRVAVARIRAMSSDDETAHSAEDWLYENVLRTIVERWPAGAGRLAQEALKTKDIEFARWCA